MLSFECDACLTERPPCLTSWLSVWYSQFQIFAWSKGATGKIFQGEATTSTRIVSKVGKPENLKIYI
jgi:hypothetical protein